MHRGKQASRSRAGEERRKTGVKSMLNNVRSPEERQLGILSGIGQDLTSLEIATKLGVRISIIKKDLKVMRYNRDYEIRAQLKQAYKDKKIRAIASKQAIANARGEKFKRMTGMTFQEKNFDNMVDYYRPELLKIIGSADEQVAIIDLPKSVQRTLVRNKIIGGLKFGRQISSKARHYLLA